MNVDLESLTSDVALKFHENHDIEIRKNFAEAIAKNYKFDCPALVLMFTHPEVCRLPLSQRCAKVGLTEEQFLLLSTQPGFLRFQKDYQEMSMSGIRTQSMDSVSQALTTKRFTYDKGGNAIDDHQLEVEVMRNISAEKKGPGVAVQINNVWGGAKAKAKALQGVKP